MSPHGSPPGQCRAVPHPAKVAPARPLAPPAQAACPEEAAGAERATAALRAWLNRGSFIMTGRIDEATDHYGRELRVVKRIRPDGSEDRLAGHMLEGGWARRYLGGWRGGWC
jgi:hypothetical protein